MPTFGFVIDNRKCIGCHACTVACKSEHQVPVGVDRTWVKYVEKGTFPDNRRYFSVMRCNHCEWAPCVTICPVTALYRRADGIVDFNSERCIGCKGCLQACPYDALYIDPVSQTAAKCNFCSHRLEVGLEPSCVVVCPEQAIIAGDLDDPTSEIARLVARHPVQVRKPEKETKPKLFYIQADEASLVPTRTGGDDQFMWARRHSALPDGRDAGLSARGVPHTQAADQARMSLPLVDTGRTARRVYDVRRREPPWGWEVAAYTWTKSVATGAFLALVAARLIVGATYAAGLALGMGIVVLLFLGLTAALLVADLKKPRRFLYVLLRPQWRSWLVRGAYLLTAYGGLVSFWLAAHIAGMQKVADGLLWPGAVLAVLSAVYTAFLFAQAKGRDFWQNPLLPLHLLAQALVAGGAVWVLVETVSQGSGAGSARALMAGALAFSLLAILGEIVTTPPTADARLALDWIIGRPMGQWFWGVGLGVGHVLALILVAAGAGLPAVLAALLALIGLYVIERLWVQAPQYIPLS